MKRILFTLAIAIPTLLAASCSKDDGDDTTGDDGDDGDDGVDPPDASPGDPPDMRPAACADLAGSWAISGQCGADLCTIQQVDCALTSVSCVSGAMSTSGEVNGTMFSYTGESGGGLDSTCTGTVNGDAMSGSCTVGVGSCTFTGTRQ